MADKPRYRGSFEGDILNLQAVEQAVADVQKQAAKGHRYGGHPAKKRYRGSFERGRLKVRPTEPPPPGRLSDPESDTLRALGNQERGGDVQLTYFPTKTSNPADPRTAAAGYDAGTRTMRVEWGDGGPAYNYYEVTPQEWQQFKRVASPGKLINRRFNDHPYGPA